MEWSEVIEGRYIVSNYCVSKEIETRDIFRIEKETPLGIIVIGWSEKPDQFNIYINGACMGGAYSIEEAKLKIREYITEKIKELEVLAGI